MKQFFVYVVAILGSTLLLGFSERWDGYEWQFALLVVGLFAGSVKGWERFRLSGFGLVFITAYGLFMVNSILYLLAPRILIILFSLMFGLILLPNYRNHRDAVLASWWVVVFNIIIYIEAASNEIVFWFTIVTTGIGAILGFHQQSLLLKHFFTVLFLLSAGGVLAGSLILKSYTYSFIVMLVVVIFGVGVYFAKRK